jgi:hypothetical protein
VSRGGQEITGLWGGKITIKVIESDGFVIQETHNVELNLDQNQNAISGRFDICDRGSGAFAATLSGTELLNVSLDDGSECVVEGSGSVNGSTLTVTTTGSCDGDTVQITIEVELGDSKC